MSAPKVEPAFYPLADIAIAWGCTAEQLEVYAIGEGDSRLQIESFKVNRKSIRGITPRERLRFESLGRSDKDGYGKQREETHLFLIGTMAMLWPLGELTKADSHYQARDLIVRDFVNRFGGGPLRSRETDALAIKAGIALVQRHLIERERHASSVASETGALCVESDPILAMPLRTVESDNRAIVAARSADA